MPFQFADRFVSQAFWIVRRAGRTRPRARNGQCQRFGGVRTVALAGGMALLAAIASAARASDTSAQTSRSDPPPDPAVSTSPPQLSVQSQRYWYGWEVALVGETGGALLSAGLLTINVNSTQPWRTFLFFPVGLPTYLLGGPLVHWSNGNFDRGLISLGLNATIPITAGFIGEAVVCARSGASTSCHSNGFTEFAAVSRAVEN